MQQHVTLIQLDIGGEDPTSLRVKSLSSQLGLECMETGDHPLDCLRAVLATGDRDGGDRKGFASIGASLGHPRPSGGVSSKVSEY